MNQKNAYMASKPRYEILDNLRGVVAIGIAWTFLKLYDEPVRAWLKSKLYPSPAPKRP